MGKVVVLGGGKSEKRCRETAPPVLKPSDGRTVRCWLAATGPGSSNASGGAV